MDEKAINRGHKYATVVSDSVRAMALDVGEGRDRSSVRVLLQDILGAIKDESKTITTGIWKANISSVSGLFPEAAPAHDRFHLIQYLNKAIDRVRRREVKQHDKLKNGRCACLKNQENRTPNQAAIFRVISDMNSQVSVALRLRKAFENIIRGDSFSDAKQCFKFWWYRAVALSA